MVRCGYEDRSQLKSAEVLPRSVSVYTNQRPIGVYSIHKGGRAEADNQPLSAACNCPATLKEDHEGQNTPCL